MNVLFLTILAGSLSYGADAADTKSINCVSITLADYRKVGNYEAKTINEKIYNSELVNGRPYLKLTLKVDSAGRKNADLVAYGEIDQDTAIFSDDEDGQEYESSLAKELFCKKTPCSVGVLSVDKKNRLDDYDHWFKGIGKRITFYASEDLNKIGYVTASLSVRSASDYSNRSPGRKLLCKIQMK